MLWALNSSLSPSELSEISPCLPNNSPHLYETSTLGCSLLFLNNPPEFDSNKPTCHVIHPIRHVVPNNRKWLVPGQAKGVPYPSPLYFFLIGDTTPTCCIEHTRSLPALWQPQSDECSSGLITPPWIYDKLANAPLYCAPADTSPTLMFVYTNCWIHYHCFYVS